MRDDVVIDFKRHGIKVLPDEDCVWLVHGSVRKRFTFEEYGGGRNAMRAALKDAGERNAIEDEKERVGT